MTVLVFYEEILLGLGSKGNILVGEVLVISSIMVLSSNMALNSLSGIIHIQQEASLLTAELVPEVGGKPQ